MRSDWKKPISIYKKDNYLLKKIFSMNVKLICDPSIWEKPKACFHSLFSVVAKPIFKLVFYLVKHCLTPDRSFESEMLLPETVSPEPTYSDSAISDPSSAPNTRSTKPRTENVDSIRIQNVYLDSVNDQRELC